MKMKKVISIALALVLAIGMLAGCGGGSGSEAAQNFAETDEKLTLTWLGYPVSHGCEEGTYPETVLEERFNVDIKPLFYEQGTYQDKKTMLMAGGEVPDLVYELDPINVFADADQDLIVELPYETIEKYAPQLYAYLNEYSPAVWSYSRYEDTNWGVPNVDHAGGMSGTVVYRADWLEKFGLDVPETLDEMHDALYKFVHEDPDGNGKDDTYGMAPYQPSYHKYFSEIFGAYGVLPFDWQEVDGKIVYGGLREETEDALQLLADWYKDGLIHPDFIAGVETSKLYTGGQLGYMTDSRYQDPTVSSSRIATIRQRTPSAKEAFALPPKGPDGLRGTRIWGVACHVASFGKTEGYGAKVPRMLQMFEGMFTDDALMTQVRLGEENKHYVNVDGAATQSMYTWDMTPEYRDGNERRLAGLAGSFNGPSFFSPIAPKDELYTNTLSDAYKTWIDTYTSEDAVLHDAFFKVDVISSAADYMEDLRNKQMKLISDIIQGTKPADQYIEEFTKLWNSGGGEEMLAEAREYQDTVEQIYKELKIK